MTEHKFTALEPHFVKLSLEQNSHGNLTAENIIELGDLITVVNHKEYNCSCGKSFKSIMEAERHLKRMEEVGIDRCPREDCDGLLIESEVGDSGERIWECRICGQPVERPTPTLEKLEEGKKVRIKETLELYPNTIIEDGEKGVITAVKDGDKPVTKVLLNREHKGLENWNNRLYLNIEDYPSLDSIEVIDREGEEQK